MSIFNQFVAETQPSIGASADVDYAAHMSVALESLHIAQTEMVKLESESRKFESMEQLAVIMDNVPEASMEMLALFENSMESLIGTDSVTVEDVMGCSLESFAGTQVSTEKLRKIAKSAWEWIKTQLKKVWKAVSDFFHSIFGATTRLRKAADRLIKRANDTAGKAVKDGKIEVGSEVNPLRGTDGKAPGKASEVIDGLSVGVSVLAQLNKDYFPELTKTGEKLADSIKSWDAEKSDAQLTDLNGVFMSSKALIASAQITKGWKNLVGSEKRYPNKNVIHTPFIGGDVIAQITKPVEAGSTASQIAESYRQGGMQVIAAKDKMPDAIKEAKIDTWTAEQCIELANKIVEICDAIEDYQRKGIQEKLVKAADKIEAASDKLGKIEKTYTAEDGAALNTSQARTAMRAALGYNTAFQNWAVNPQTAIIRNLFAAARAGLSVANKSLSQYK